MLSSGIGFLLLVLTSTVIWPITLWTTKKGARPEMNGLMISLVAFALSTFFVITQHKWAMITGELIILGIITGFAYSIGFCVFIFNCLKIGPSGLTTMINNLGLVGAIFVGVALDKPAAKDIAMIVFGLLLIVIALAIINTAQGNGTKISKKWIIYVSIGGALSVISFMCNSLAGKKYPGGSFTFTMITYAASITILLIYTLIRRCKLPNRYEVINGSFVGSVNVFGGVIMFGLLEVLSPVIVYSVSVVSPIIVMILLGHFFLDEKLTKKVVAGVLLGLLGMTILSFYQ